MDDKILIKGTNLIKYYGETKVLDDINIDIHQGESIAVIGPSGSGKSTLLRVLAGLEDPTSGTAEYDGEKVSDKKAYDSTEIGVIFQSFDLFPHLTAAENIALAPRLVHNLSKDEASKMAMEMLAKVHLEDRGDHYPQELSGGQQQRIAIARALAMQPRVMFFDEPTSALDPEMTVEVLNIIEELVQGGMTVFIVTHEMEFARRIAHRVIFMDTGEVLEDMPASKLSLSTATNPRIIKFLSQLEHYNEKEKEEQED